MRFRVGIVMGFAAGYYLGTKAGIEQHKRINEIVRKARYSDAVDLAAGKAKAVVDLGVERARDLTSNRFGTRNGSDLAAG